MSIDYALLVPEVVNSEHDAALTALIYSLTVHEGHARPNVNNGSLFERQVILKALHVDRHGLECHFTTLDHSLLLFLPRTLLIYIVINEKKIMLTKSYGVYATLSFIAQVANENVEVARVIFLVRVVGLVRPVDTDLL